MIAEPKYADLSSEEFGDRTFTIWLERLRQHWEEEPYYKWDYFRDNIIGRSDAFTYLHELHRGDPDLACRSIISATVDRIQSERFDISDLFAETRLLIEVLHSVLFNDTLEECDALKQHERYRRELDSLFEAVIIETSVVYELFSERGTQALCVLDARGRITYANRSAERLFGFGPLNGKDLATTIYSATQERVDEILANLVRPLSHIETIKIQNCVGQTRIMSAEFTQIPRATERCAYCVAITPASWIFGLEDEILEDFEEGVVRVNADREICYANRRARKLLGREPFTPVSIYQVFQGKKNRRKVDEELRKRDAGQLGKYDADLITPSGRRTSIRITAIPEFDMLGNRVGSVAFFRDIEQRKVRAELDACLQVDKSWKDAARTLCKVLMKHVKADMITLYRFTDDMYHSSPIIGFRRNGEEYKFKKRWFPMSKPQRKWNRQTGLQNCGDFEEFLQKKPWQNLAKDSAVRELTEVEKFQSFIRLPVRKDGDFKAGLSFFSTRLNGFSENEIDLLKVLPLTEIVLSITQRCDRDEREFQFNLMKKMVACESFTGLANLVCSTLASQYEWDHVSIFDVIEEHQMLKMIAQSQGSNIGYRLHDGYQQSINDGLLGQAVRDERTIYAADVIEKENYKVGHDKTQSEIIIPIFSKAYDPARVFWLLNVEHSQSGFLIEHEIEDLQTIAQEIEFIVNRIVDRSTYENALRITSDGVIITDSEGGVRHINPAAASMLQYEPSELLGRSVRDIFVDRELAESFLQGRIDKSRKVKMIRAGEGPSLTAFLSVLQLPDEISDCYFIFKNLETEERLADLEAIEERVSDIAQEIKTPLSLLHGMLPRLSTREGERWSRGFGDFVSRTRAQLKKIELTFDRLAYADPITQRDRRKDTLVHLDRVVSEISKSITVNNDGEIDLLVVDDLPPAIGNHDQLNFAFTTLVSSLLRNLPESGRIKVELHCEKNQILATLSAPFPGQENEQIVSDTEDADKIITNMMRAHKLIEPCIENHQGVLEVPKFDGTFLSFNVSLPAYDPDLE